MTPEKIKRPIPRSSQFLPSPGGEAVPQKSLVRHKKWWCDPHNDFFMTGFASLIYKKVEQLFLAELLRTGVPFQEARVPMMNWDALGAIAGNLLADNGCGFSQAFFMTHFQGEGRQAEKCGVYLAKGNPLGLNAFFQAAKVGFQKLGIPVYREFTMEIQQNWSVESAHGNCQLMFCPQCLIAKSRGVVHEIGEDQMSSPLLPVEIHEVPPFDNEVELAGRFNLSLNKIIKTHFFEVPGKPRLLAVLTRADQKVNFNKLRRALGIELLYQPDGHRLTRWLKCTPCFMGPVGLPECDMVADRGVKELVNFVCGLNQESLIMKNANFGRDFPACPTYDLIHEKSEAPCPNCFSPLIAKNSAIALSAREMELLGSEGLYQPGYQVIIYFDRLFQAMLSRKQPGQSLSLPKILRPFDGTLVLGPDLGEVAEEVVATLHALTTDEGWNFLIDDRRAPADLKMGQVAEWNLFPCLIFNQTGEPQFTLKAHRDSPAVALGLSEVVPQLKNILNN